MRRPAIPSVPNSPDKARMRFDAAIKERLELAAGERGEKIKLLDPGTATSEDIASKLNELIALLQ